jgi:small subunit ribosomal protein S1
MKRRIGDSGDGDFAAILAAFESRQAETRKAPPAVGERVSARVVGVGEESVFVDLGGKAEGVIPLTQLTDDEGKFTVAVGDVIEGVVASIEDDVAVLRVRAGRGPAAPAELQQAYEHGLPVAGVVQAVVKGGVEVSVSGQRAFCPVSQLDSRYVEDPSTWVGQRLDFRITRLEEGRGRGMNLVLSRRALLEEEAKAKAEATRAKIEVGKTVRGTVTSLASYGAFVDLGGIEGLLHVSELGHGRIEHPQEVLRIGDEVEVQILAIAAPDARGRERISLSRRALTPDPWLGEAAKLAPGARRSGRVARLETFGAFVELAPGVDGLLHVSELAELGKREIRHARDVLKVGQQVEVTVLSISPETRRISLALARGGEAGEVTAAGGATTAESGFGALGDFFARLREGKS